MGDELNTIPGLKTDLETLLTQFSSTKSVRYAEFSKIWRQMGFPTIFCGWGTESALRELLETSFYLAVSFWQDVYTFQVRMGGLYLLYAFFFTQPLDPPQKIRLTQTQWNLGRKLLQTIQEQKHLDAEFIYFKLHYHRAFYYVMSCLPYQIAVTRKNVKDELMKREMVANESVTPKNVASVHTVFPNALVNNIETIHNQYREMKHLLASTERISESDGLNTLKDDFFDVLKNGLKFIETWKPGTPSFDPDTVPKATVTTSPQRQGDFRRRLKEHAFERQGIVGRHQRHIVVDSSASASDSDKDKNAFASPQRPKRKKKRQTNNLNVTEAEILSSSMPLGFDDVKVDDDELGTSSSDDHEGLVNGHRNNLDADISGHITDLDHEQPMDVDSNTGSVKKSKKDKGKGSKKGKAKNR